MRILHVVGARPNFMKVAPVMAAFAARPGVEQVLVHTGQHYDANMSGIFFEQLGMPRPDINLEVGSGTHAAQTAEVMVRLEPVIIEQKPDWVFVYGDINSTVAASLVCAKLLVKVAHVEAGLRSFDRTMPEEVNRLVTDRLADLLLTPSADGNENLAVEGTPAGRVHLVGNVMIDTLVRLLPRAGEGWPALREQLGLASGDTHEPFALVTLHRPSNVDEPVMLRKLMETISAISRRITCIFPIHPRTRQRLKDMGIELPAGRVRLADPMGYLEFLALQKHATAIITDSGGIQEEASYLGTPCLTLRENTERPITVTMGTNILIGRDTDLLQAKVEAILDGKGKSGEPIPFWDGKAGERIADLILGLG